ncbi:MAG: non-ribosomal peptide synthetase, partial [Arenicella sp.]|nr:non-ribosomal peptide synthetase [Arenicella sp.]
GEALPKPLEEQFFANMASGTQLHNLYGPTEAAIDVSYWACEQGSQYFQVPIGRPISNTQLLVLDQHNQLLPQGVVGELHIGGLGLARGYLNRPELTQERFIANRFSSQPGARLYKTGDLVHWLADGNLAFIGRIDDQVKIRGFRIELGEIESTLLRLDNVRDATVIAYDEPTSLVAFVVPTIQDGREQADFIEQCRSSLKLSLPDYMLPSLFVVLDEIPLTPNGKVDRNSLNISELSIGQHEFVAPTSKTEQMLCEIWQDLLGIEQVGVTDNFFELGGHSLLAIRMVTHVNTSLSINLNLREIFTRNTIRSIAALIELEIKLSTVDIEMESDDQSIEELDW